MNFTATVESDSGPVTGQALMGAEMTRLAWDLYPYGHTGHVNTTDVLDLVEMLPSGMTMRRYHSTKGLDIILARGAEAVLYIRHQHNSMIVCTAAASEPQVAKDIVEGVLDTVPETIVEDDSVQFWLWYLAGHGPEEASKTIKAPTWDEVSRNYSVAVASELAELMKVEKPESSGKIILWHGVPGTGKTSAIRTLMREWKDWCQFHYVADPEDLFKRPSYLMEVATGDTNKWRLVIAEDTDGLLRPDARNDSGSGLGRLLNFSDGILGQGCNTLFLLTTNVKLDGLHPALTRPGRCLAQLEFTKFSHNEMASWLPEGIAVPGEDKTLAELLDHVNKRQIKTGLETKEFGTYI
jgi:hypothetical protein